MKAGGALRADPRTVVRIFQVCGRVQICRIDIPRVAAEESRY